MNHVLDEAANDLEEVHGKALEESERRHSRPEVVQRKQAAKRLQFAEKSRCLVEIGDRRRFRELKADGPRAHDVTPELLANEFEEALVPDRGARNIDGIGSASCALGTQGIDLSERVLNDPLSIKGNMF